jgi:hypothetical protein
MRQFELLEDLGAGRSARAALLEWNGRKYVRSRQIVELFDFVGMHGDRGDRGYMFYSPESQRWEAACGQYEQVAPWLPS